MQLAIRSPDPGCEHKRLTYRKRDGQRRVDVLSALGWQTIQVTDNVAKIVRWIDG
jgi:hypothetical protein